MTRARHFTPVEYLHQPLTPGHMLIGWAVEQAMVLASDYDVHGPLSYLRLTLHWSRAEWDERIDALCDLADEISAAELVADGPRQDVARVDYRDALAAVTAGPVA